MKEYNLIQKCRVCGGVHDTEDATLLSQYACVKCGGTHGSDILDNRGWCLRDRRGFKITRKVIHSLPLIQDNGNWKPQPICEDCLRSVHGVMIYVLTTNVVLAAKWNTEINFTPRQAPIPPPTPRRTKEEREEVKREEKFAALARKSRYQKRPTQFSAPRSNTEATPAEVALYFQVQEKKGSKAALQAVNYSPSGSETAPVIILYRRGAKTAHAGYTNEDLAA